ncbi:Attacin-B, partial [Frankliniella fusca]
PETAKRIDIKLEVDICRSPVPQTARRGADQLQQRLQVFSELQSMASTAPAWLVAVVSLVSTVAAVEVLEASGRSVVQTKYDAAAKKQELDYKVRGRQEAQPNFYYQPIAANRTELPPLFKPSSGGRGSSGSSRDAPPWRFGSSDSSLPHRGGLSDDPGPRPSESSFFSRLSSGKGSFSSNLNDFADASRKRESGARATDTLTAPRSSRLAEGPAAFPAADVFPTSKSPRSSRFASGGDFSSSISSGDDSRLDFSSGLSDGRGFSKGFAAGSGSGSKLSSGGDGSFSSSSGSSSSSSDGPSGGFLSGFFPSLSPFGTQDASPFPSRSPFADESDGVSSFSRTPPSTLTLFATSSSFVDDDDDDGASSSSSGRLRGEDSDPGRPSYASDEDRGDADSGGRYERGYLHTREFRDTKAVGSPGTAAPPPAARPSRTRGAPGRYKRKRQHKTLAEAKPPLRNYSEQQYRTPYSDHRDNHTDYKYYEDHDGNDTHREHHYRHVVSYHHYYNASDGNASTAAPYSRDAAYDALRLAKKHNYNVDHVYNADGRYIPIVHKPAASGNLTEGDFPDGPHVKHHYYYNEYTHDHRNKSEGPTVRHHYHDKDVKVFYHDHRNKSGSSGDSKYSTYSPGAYSSSSTYGPDYQGSESSSSSEGYASSSSSEKPIVKHHHHVKEFHYDEKGRLIDPKKYNYTNMYSSSNYTKYDDDDTGGSSGEDGDEESRGSYSEPSGDTRHASDQDDDGREDGGDGRHQTHAGYRSGLRDDHATKSYYYNSNHHNHYSGRNRETTHGAPRATAARYETAAEDAGSAPLPPPHRAPPAAAFRPAKAAVGYQLHYRDFGDHTFSSKEVSFEDGFSFHKEKRGGPSGSYLETYTSPGGGGGYFSSFRSARDGGDDAAGGRLRGLGGSGYRSGLVTRDVEPATALAGGKRAAVPVHALGTNAALAGLGHHAARAFPDHTRSLVSRGNIGYILVDPLGELPTIRIHASLVNSPHHPAAAVAHSAPYPRYAPAPSLSPVLAHGLAHGLAPAAPTRTSFFSTSDPFHPATAPVTALRRVDHRWSSPSPSPPSTPSPTPTAPTTPSPTTSDPTTTPTLTN